MKERDVVLTEGKTGLKIKARLLCCPDCDGCTFLCFFPEGVAHMHFQCRGCGISFCDGCTAPGPVQQTGESPV